MRLIVQLDETGYIATDAVDDVDERLGAAYSIRAPAQVTIRRFQRLSFPTSAFPSADGWLIEINPETLPRVLINQNYFTTALKHKARIGDDQDFLAECMQTTH